MKRMASSWRPVRTTGCALLAVLSACGSGDGGNDHAAAFRPAARAMTAAPRFAAMNEADIRRSAIGCLQHPPYPLDGGPTCLRQDGSWISYSGWGNAEGRYRIIGNTIVLGPSFGGVAPSPGGDRPGIDFFRDRRGGMFIRYDGDRRRPFTPFAEADYHQWIGPVRAPAG